jgi:hypothetical protein
MEAPLYSLPEARISSFKLELRYSLLNNDSSCDEDIMERIDIPWPAVLTFVKQHYLA